jgi:hypothetical protein
MAVLVIVALFWGNCFSCPQLLQSAISHQAAHGCCHKSKDTRTQCQTQGLRHFVKSAVDFPAPDAVVSAAMVEAPATVAVFPSQGSTPAFSPPDLVPLNSSFRI